ncbi:MAG: 4Fe-4S binding protein [Zhengella sp.]|uniref:4Fe-4S dicluster domain-containing protein n=1 Tax=Zhengella sp. TaxID=2282762 RepID=UPI001E03E03A|nr:4Fe-4S binding protein [Notoacmeibacter sp.]
MLRLFGPRNPRWPDRLPATPDIDPDRCLLGGDIAAECQLCKNVCPQGAIVQDEDCLGIDTQACTGCGLCQPVCPPAAIDMVPALPERPAGPGRAASALAICRRSDQPEWATVPCIHAIDLAALAGLHARGIGQLDIRIGDCARCDLGRPGGFDDTLALFNAMMESRGLATLAVDDAQDQPPRLQEYQAPDRPDAARRRLLLGAVAHAGQERTWRRQALVRLLLNRPAGDGEARCQAVPHIDAEACIGCDMCTRVCPEGAIRLVKNDTTGAAYELVPDACSGCGLCAAACDSKAIDIEKGGTGKTGAIALHHLTCAACGAGYHQPCVRVSESRLCPTCQKTNHHAKLFQVMP